MTLWQKDKISFFDYFESHAEQMHLAALLLQKLFSNDTPAVEIAQKIKSHEHTADQIAHAVMNQLNKTFIHPIDREDIVDFTKALDDVVDEIHHCSESYARIFELTDATDYARRFSELIVKASEMLKTTCGLLRLPSRNVTEIVKNCIEIHRLENVADDVRQEALHSLFVRLKSQQIPLPDYLAWSEIYELLEKIADRTEDCADMAEQIATKYS